jgi:hypothetical protein
MTVLGLSPVVGARSEAPVRDDMDKVIVERPRTHGNDRVRSEWSKIADWRVLRSAGREDESPRREKLMKKWSNPKSLSDNLSPLVRYVRSNVGRPWNKVHSEICERIRRTNTVQRHVLEHLERDIVHQNVVEQSDGSITDPRGRSLRRWMSGDVFYVCPRTKLLRRIAGTARRRRSDPLQVDVTTPYHRVNGLWFEVRFMEIPVRIPTVWDVLLKSHATLGGYASPVRHWKDGGRLFAVSKRQLSSKEISRFGLSKQ